MTRKQNILEGLALILSLITIHAGCKPHNYQSLSDNKEQSEIIRICEVGAGERCLQFEGQSESLFTVHKGVNLTDKDASATWELYQNDKILTLQPTHVDGKYVILENTGSDLQKTRLLQVSTGKYLKTESGSLQVLLTDKVDEATEFSVLKLSRITQNNSLR
jgi:hypothetical protein